MASTMTRAALLVALIGMWAFAAPANARADGARQAAAAADFDVLVFSRTTGFRHETAIAAGRTAITEMGAAGNFAVTLSEDASLFTDAGLRPFEVVVFLNTDGEGILSAPQRTAFERWTQRGGGIVSIHADANADRDWAWKGDMMGGAWFLNHPSGAQQFQNATVNVEDATHPATAGVPSPWVREDEWYNFTAEPRGKVHVLLTLDEGSYDEQDGSAEADDHPIAWCSNYDGGRHFYTALGHHGSYWAEPAYRAHILGAIDWASGRAEGDCGADREGIPTDAAFDKVTLDDNTENPMEIAVDPDGDVYYVELAGRVKHYDRSENRVRAIGTIPVHRGNENGLLGITLDPAFATNRRLYLFYSAPSPEIQRVSRFTVAADGTLDMASERVLLEFPHQRIVCCHSAGSMTFGPDGNLYISTGDDTEHAASNGFNPIDDDVLRNNPGSNPDADRAYDARRSSGNTNDLRGKILRIRPREDPSGTPGPGNTYDIPAGNLYGLGGRFPGVEGQTRPEIYTMGHRNPFRIQVDQETGWLYNGEVGPDAGSENPNRGPRGYDELNQIRQAGNMGWPYCIADNKPYRDWTFPSGPAGETFDCAGGPANTSAYNTGLGQTPPAGGALLWWPYGPYPSGFPWGSPPTAIPTGPGRTAIAGPTYHFDPESPAETKFPAYYDDKVFFADWSRDWLATLTLDAAGQPAAIEEFMPGGDFRHPQDLEMGADGSLYVLEWGRDFNYAGAGINPDSGLYRIDFAKGARTPVARASADRDSGPAPLTVNFSSAGSEDADGDELTFEWDFDDGSPVSTEPNPSHTFAEAGTYTVRLTATDPTGKAGTSTVVINAGNTRPQVAIDLPQGGFFDWGDEIPYTITVTDPEDGEIDCERVNLNPGIFHDEGGNAHVHPGVSQTGCSGTIDAPAESGHAKSANIALVLVAAYTDEGGAPGSSPLEGGATRRLNPKTLQAEHYTAAHAGTQLNNRPAAEGGYRVGFNDAGEWIAFEPVSLHQVESLTVRYTSGGNGGIVDLRLDATDGPVVGTVELPNSGGWDTYAEVTAPITPPDSGSHRLYLTYRALPGQPGTDLFDLDELRFGGRGVASNSAPTAAIEADPVSGSVPLLVNFTAVAEDADGDAITYAWDFDSDGTVDATTPTASHTYTTPDVYDAKLTVTDSGGRARTATIEIEAFPPIGQCPGDDDFTGTSLGDLWEVVRETPADLTVADGGLTIHARPGDIFGTSENGSQGPMQNIVLQPLPESGPWTATTRVTWNPTANYQNAGFKIYDNDDGWIKFGMVWSGGRKFELFKEVGDSPANLNTSPTLPAEFPTTFQMRLVSDGEEIRAQYSADGQEWTSMGTAAADLSGFTNPRIGMYATSTNQPSIPARFDWFRLDAPAEPDDEFDGDALDTCRWTDIVRHDPLGYEVADGKLVLPAAHGDFFGNAPNDNPNMILQPAPAGEWSATTRVTFTPDENYEQAGLLVYADDANYVKANLVSTGGNRAMEFLRETNNVATGFGGSVTLPADFPDTVDIRVVSDGTTLRASYRAAGASAWLPFGEPAPLAPVPNPRIGVYANDGNQTVATREDAAFDFFRIGEDDPGPEPGAPTVQGFADPASGAAPLRVRFSATGVDPDGGPVSYAWDFGDGTAVGSSVVRTYPEPGEYTATVTVTDDEGATASDEVVVTVTEPANEPPSVTASVDVASGPAPLAVRFDATGTDPDGPESALTYAWDFGDGGTSLARRPRHTYLEPGTYTATVTVTDAGGASGTADVEVVVSDPPANRPPSVAAGAVPSSGPAPLRVRFTSQGTDPDGDALTYAWDFGDDTEGATTRNANHTYAAAGTYTATVTVTDEEGATGSADVQVVVGDPPGNQAPTVQAAADPGSGSAPLRVRFTSVGRDPDGDALMYVWSFGDGGQAGGRNAVHTYTAPGTYEAEVTVTDPDGDSGTATVTVVVAAPRAASAPGGSDGAGGAGSDAAGGGAAAGGGSASAVAGDTATGGALARVARPGSVVAFRARGIRVTLTCPSAEMGTATATLPRAVAKRLGVRRTIARRTVRCGTTARLRPSRKVAGRLTARRLRVTVDVSFEGVRGLRRVVTLG